MLRADSEFVFSGLSSTSFICPDHETATGTGPSLSSYNRQQEQPRLASTRNRRLVGGRVALAEMWRLRGEGGVIRGTVLNFSCLYQRLIEHLSTQHAPNRFQAVPPRLLCLRLSLVPSPGGFPLAAGLLLPTRLLTAGPKGGLGSHGAIRFL